MKVFKGIYFLTFLYFPLNSSHSKEQLPLKTMSLARDLLEKWDIPEIKNSIKKVFDKGKF